MYSERFRSEMVSKMLGPNAVSANALADRVGVGHTTLSRWLREAKMGLVSRGKQKATATPKRRRQWTAAEKLRVVIEAVGPSVPVTVKHRAGWDDKHLNAPEFACALVESGAKMITVHGRTRTQGFTGRASREIIRKVREAVPSAIPVVGNGDVITPDDYFRMREETGCDAVMIGRGAIGNPWLFRSVVARLRAEPDPGPPTISERLIVIRRHLELMRAHTPPKRLIHEIRKGCAWYSKGLPGCAAFRDRTQHLIDLDTVLAEAETFFEEQLNRRAAA